MLYYIVVPHDGVPKPAPDDQPERQFCPYANKGICRSQDNKCKYLHTRCKNYDSCSQSDCLFAHAPSRNRPGNQNPCLNDNRCHQLDCKFKHPQGWSVCNDGVRCINPNCNSNHPPRPPICRDGNRCNKSDCRFRHPNNTEGMQGKNHQTSNFAKAPPTNQTRKNTPLEVHPNSRGNRPK